MSVSLVRLQLNLNFLKRFSKNGKIPNFITIRAAVQCVQTDGRTVGRTDVIKLIVAFHNFENAHKNMKKCKLKLKYNYSIIKTFLQIRLLPQIPHRFH